MDTYLMDEKKEGEKNSRRVDRSSSPPYFHGNDRRLSEHGTKPSKSAKRNEEGKKGKEKDKSEAKSEVINEQAREKSGRTSKSNRETESLQNTQRKQTEDKIEAREER